jgi:hypothetical protein
VSLYHNNTGRFNVAVGSNSLFTNSSGTFNTAVGYLSLNANTDGASNAAIGNSALASNTYGSYNVAAGSGALLNSNSGFYNTALGAEALQPITSGVNNIAIGFYAGQYLSQDGSDNIDIGSYGMASDYGVIRIGDSSVQTATYLAGTVYGRSFVSISDVNRKADFRAIEPAEILAGVANLPVQTWRYKGDPRHSRHIGPTAQDFYKAFAVGEDDKHIGMIDEGGVALAAVKAVNERLEAEQALTTQLRREVEQLRRMVEEKKGTAIGDGK